jgi:hypothetical protein
MYRIITEQIRTYLLKVIETSLNRTDRKKSNERIKLELKLNRTLNKLLIFLARLLLKTSGNSDMYEKIGSG